MRLSPRPLDVHVGQRLRLRRMMIGMTQTELADAVGVTFQQIQKYEKGTNRIGGSRLYQFAKALAVTIPYFFEDMADGIVSPSARQAKKMPPGMDNEMTQPETLELVRSYYSIKDQGTRARLLDLMKQAAG